jgi:hypothetical protein
MNVVSEVMIIAVSTAVLAALIVAADWDLVVIRALQPQIAAHQSSDWNTMGRPTLETSATWRAPLGGRPDIPEVERTPVVPGGAEVGRSAADEWLAAAAAGRLPEWRRTDLGQATQNPPAPARPLREVLAARRNDRPVDAAAA